MPLRIERVDTEIEIFRKETGGPSPDLGTGRGSETASALTGRAALREKLRPIVMEILNEELMRIKRKVGAP